VDESSPAARTLRALADAVGESRPRHPDDGADPTVPVAGTVVVVRDGTHGVEVLMIERPDRGSFAGAWVFPGGKLEAGDRVEDDEGQSARRAAARETHEETGLVVDAATLVPLSCWDPPPGLPLRIRTWFFLAADPGGAHALAPDEVVAAEWVRPLDMLARHGRGEVTLYPPTWVTLQELGDQPTATALLSAVRLRGLERFETVARRGDEGPMMLWQGDAEYADAGLGGASRHRLEIGGLPWIYRRADSLEG
jgi:8-oxo-dGTP pyrophosphatase MutT (NUDIX family)